MAEVLLRLYFAALAATGAVMGWRGYVVVHIDGVPAGQITRTIFTTIAAIGLALLLYAFVALLSLLIPARWRRKLRPA